MKKTILYNPSLSTLNMGDKIIFDSITRELRPLFQDSFIVEVSTHLPISRFFAKYLSDADQKFVCGTNLLRNDYKTSFRQWDINALNVKYLAPCVLVGVGWHKSICKLSPYASYLYKSILDKKQTHSVRDSYTKIQMEKLGFTNVINTGCPTMWMLSPSFCKGIPAGKAKEVVFTLTDYCEDKEKDLLVLHELKKAYDRVHIWLQGFGDYEYAKRLGIIEQVNLISPSLEAYDLFLSNHDVDYIGTRLHGGIRALQHKKRTMILAVDGRATAKKADFNLPVIERNLVDEKEIRKTIFDDRTTEINIPENDILMWKNSVGII